jgi:pimeloyl-ACP methyl ester carboxylesterase
VAGTELDHHRGGAGDPLVLVHGLGHTWRGWKPMLPLLEERFDVLAVDLPGFGYSPPLPAAVESSPEVLADALEGAMDAAGFETSHLAGNSLGAWICLELARRGRAATVTAISPAGLASGREARWGAGILRAERWLARNAPAPEALLRSRVGRTLFAGPAFGRPWRIDPDDLIEQSRLFAETPGFEPTLARVVGAQVRGLDVVRCPVLLLWGTKDVILLPRQARRFERLIPDAELRYLKGLGHVPMSDDPELLCGAIAEFAVRVRPGPGLRLRDRVEVSA